MCIRDSYRGDQPILYRKKVNRPEVNNKLVLNLAYELVERKTAEICAEPIQYVLRGTDAVSYTHLDVYKRQPICRYNPN